MPDELTLKGELGTEAFVRVAGEESAPHVQGLCEIVLSDGSSPGDPPALFLNRTNLGLLIRQLTMIHGTMR